MQRKLVRSLTYSWFSRYSTTRGSSTGLCRVGPAKVKASKSIIYTEGPPEVEIILLELL